MADRQLKVPLSENPPEDGWSYVNINCIAEGCKGVVKMHILFDGGKPAACKELSYFCPICETEYFINANLRMH